MYHGLNFAAYGGKMNKFDVGGKYNDTFMKEMGLRWVPADQVQGDYREKVLQHNPNGTYAVDANSNYVPASRMETLWTDYLTKQDQPDIAIDREIELAKQHRANERFNKSVDAAAIGLMSIPGLIPVAGTALPLLAPGTVGGTLIGEAAGGMAMGELVNEGSKALTGRSWGKNLRQGLENTFGYTPKLWNPYVQGAYDFFTDMTNPFYYNTKPLKNVITAAESGLTTVAENLYPTVRNTYLSYNLNKAPNRLFSNANNSIFPDIYHQSIYTPQNISQTRWLAEDMSAPELSGAAKNAAQKIASNKNATFNIRRDYDLMYRGNEYNAAIHEGRYPREDGSIPETYQQTVQSETENAIQRMANMGIKEHGVILDDIASNIRNNAAKTRINLVNRENSSPTFDNPDTRATTTLNNRNFSSEWIVSDADANPATINIPLFDTSRRYSNILEPVREIRIPFNSEISNRGVMGVDRQWRLNDPYFGDAVWEYDLGRLPSTLWDDMQHEAQHAVG